MADPLVEEALKRIEDWRKRPAEQREAIIYKLVQDVEEVFGTLVDRSYEVRDGEYTVPTADSGDREVDAIAACLYVLMDHPLLSLDRGARKRVVTYLQQRMDAEEVGF